MKAFMDERNLDLIFLAVFRSLFQYTVLMVFFGKREEEGRQQTGMRGENRNKGKAHLVPRGPGEGKIVD